MYSPLSDPFYFYINRLREVSTLAEIINSLGLALDIVGVVLIFRYGLPEEVNRTGASYFTNSPDPESEDAKKAKRYDKLSRFGLILLVAGFTLQIISNWI